MKISLKEKILVYTKGLYPRAVHSGDLERFGQSQGQKGETTGRRARELAAVGMLERIEINGSVSYRYKFQANELPPARGEAVKLTPSLL